MRLPALVVVLLAGALVLRRRAASRAEEQLWAEAGVDPDLR